MRPTAMAIRAALLVAIVAAVPAIAQTTGALVGRVVDSAGAPIPGALIEVKSPMLIRPRQAGSNQDGAFNLQLLPPGAYSVLARLTGFQDAVLDGVRVPLGETVTVTMTLKLGAEASVTVTSEESSASVFDLANPRSGITATEKTLASLPLGRNYSSAANLAPGASTDIRGPTFYGASSLENTFMVEGVNVTGIRYGGQGKNLPLEFVQEVEVRSSGYEAEFGKALGGSVNVITKSGGNDFHGNVFGYYDSDQLGAADQHEADRIVVGLGLPEVPRQYDVGFSLGGPVVKDRLWFFGAYDRARSDLDYQARASITYSSTGVVTGTTYEDRTETTTSNLFAAKLSFSPTVGSQNVTLSLFGDPKSYKGRSLGVSSANTGPASAREVGIETGGTDIALRWSGFLGSLLGEAHYGYHEEPNRDKSDYAHTLAIIEGRSGQSQFVTGSGPQSASDVTSGGLVDESYSRNVFDLSGSLQLGNHDLKAGLGYELVDTDRLKWFPGGGMLIRVFRPNGNLNYVQHRYLAQVPMNCQMTTDGKTGNFGPVDPYTCKAWEMADSHRSDLRMSVATVYLQDRWRPWSNLTVNFGLRYDYETLETAAEGTRLKLTDQWSPRLSAVWDPAGKGRSRVYASYGRYYQMIPQNLQISNLSEEYYGFSYNRTTDRPDPTEAMFDYAFVYGGDYFPEGLKGTYQDELTAGADVQLGAAWTVGLKGIYRALGRALENRCDLSDKRMGLQGFIPPSDGSFVTCAMVNPGEAGALNQMKDPSNPDCVSETNANGVPTLITGPCESTHARRYFRALEFTVQHRPAKGLYLQGSYVLSRLEGSYEGLISEGRGMGPGYYQWFPNTNTDFDYVDMLPNGYGRLSNDRTHQVKVSGAYTSPFGLTAGLVYRWESGRPLSIYKWVTGGRPGFVVERGSNGEMPSVYQLDLHLEYPISLGGVSIVPVADVFNVTDTQPALTRDQNSGWSATTPPNSNPTNPTYGKDRSWQAPRLVRLGLRVVF